MLRAQPHFYREPGMRSTLNSLLLLSSLGLSGPWAIA
jgi:hypothetical protein